MSNATSPSIVIPARAVCRKPREGTTGRNPPTP